MANSSSEDETDTLPERPTRIQPYQFEPARQDFERVPVFHGVCKIALTEVLATQMGVMRRSKKVRLFELYKFNLLSGESRLNLYNSNNLTFLLRVLPFTSQIMPYTAGRLRGELVHCYTWGSSANCYSSRQHSRPA